MIVFMHFTAIDQITHCRLHAHTSVLAHLLGPKRYRASSWLTTYFPKQKESCILTSKSGS